MSTAETFWADVTDPLKTEHMNLAPRKKAATGAAGSIAIIHTLVRNGWSPAVINHGLRTHLHLHGMETGWTP